MRLLMVCLGNICRSPLAEGIMQHKAALAGLGWTVESAGTGSWHIGEPPHHLSQKTARQYGIDISGQRARRFTAADMDHFDHIFFMDENNLEDARRMAGARWNPKKASLLMSWVPESPHTAVPDPYFGEEEGYHEVFHMISQACDAFIARQISTNI